MRKALHILTESVVLSWLILFSLMIEAIYFSETSVPTRATKCHPRIWYSLVCKLVKNRSSYYNCKTTRSSSG
jgi:hypothetical protein